MQRPVITFDLDDVVFLSGAPVAEFLRARGFEPDYGDFNYKWLPPEVHKELYKFFVGPEYYGAPLTSPNAPAYIGALRKDYDVRFVTARPEKCRDLTVAQFTKGGIYVDRADITFLGIGADKIAVLKEINPKLHIDDGARIIELCVENGINHLMISNEYTGWNHYLRDDPRVRFVENLDEFWKRREEFLCHPREGGDRVL
ncbi:MAG: hypothetical protein LBQ49_01195 [Rickettsiales bacterium]|jgi:hypothetical protein|nr:hypothetical protein [Rickettsiales bacterium]